MKIISDISWGRSILYSFIPGVVSFSFFILIEVIWGDLLGNYLSTLYESEEYLFSTLILWIGIAFVVVISLVANVRAFENYRLGPRITANIFTIIATLIILLIFSWVSIVLIYTDMYLELDLLGTLRLFPLFYTYFAIYVLPNPVWFWVLTFAIYHLILVIFIKLLFIKEK
jgi:hypothetical protein